ncbi:hypothetical protein Bca4012_031982 [Brassica carinata]
MDGKKSKRLIETQPMESAHRLLHLSLSNGIGTQTFCFIRFRSRRGLRDRIDPWFGSPTVGEEERAQRKAQRSLTSHQIEDVEEDETRRRESDHLVTMDCRLAAQGSMGIIDLWETWKLLREEKPKCEWVPGVYFPQATPKCAFISWLATLNKLSTMDQIQNWNRGVNTDCVFSVSKIWKLETTCSLSASTLFRSGKHSENEYYNANSRTTGQQLFKSSQTKV